MKTKWFPLHARTTKRTNNLSIIFLKFIDFEPSKISEVNFLANLKFTSRYNIEREDVF